MHPLNGKEGKEATEIRVGSKRQRRGQTGVQVLWTLKIPSVSTKTGVNSCREIQCSVEIKHSVYVVLTHLQRQVCR